jgi:hypothetical protein
MLGPRHEDYWAQRRISPEQKQYDRRGGQRPAAYPRERANSSRKAALESQGSSLSRAKRAAKERKREEERGRESE